MKNYLKLGAKLKKCLYTPENGRFGSDKAGLLNRKAVKRSDGYIFSSYTLAAKCLGYKESSYITYSIKNNKSVSGYNFTPIINNEEINVAKINNKYIESYEQYLSLVL